MEPAVDIRIIDSDEITCIIPLIRHLNPSLPETLLVSRLEEMVGQGYQCAGLYSGRNLIGICGFWIITKFYVGKHIEPDNVFILPEYRRQGLGGKILSWLHEYGQTQGCEASELNCYLDNEAGNRFWEEQGFRKIGYHYQKLLNPA